VRTPEIMLCESPCKILIRDVPTDIAEYTDVALVHTYTVRKRPAARVCFSSFCTPCVRTLLPSARLPRDGMSCEVAYILHPKVDVHHLHCSAARSLKLEQDKYVCFG
jgi:hypothetical protein